MTSTTTEPGPGAPSTAGNRVRLHWPNPANYTGFFIWAVFILVFGLWVPDTFLTTLTLKSVLSGQAVTAIVAFGLLIPLAAGAYDLSVGAMAGFAAVLVTDLTANQGFSPVTAIAVTIAVGACVGAINGGLVVGVGINSFITTLAMSSLLAAAAVAVSGDTTIFGSSKSFNSLTTGQPLGIPIVAVYMFVIAAIVWYVLERAPVGRRLVATGSGLEAARLAGVRTKRVIFGAMVSASVLASIAGVLLASKLGAVDPSLGSSYLLPAFAAAFLGTTQVRVGRFNVVGTLIAIFLLATGVVGLQLAGAANWVPDAFNGVALIVAVGLSLWGGRLATLKRHLPGRRGASEPGTPESE